MILTISLILVASLSAEKPRFDLWIRIIICFGISITIIVNACLTHFTARCSPLSYIYYKQLGIHRPYFGKCYITCTYYITNKNTSVTHLSAACWFFRDILKPMRSRFMWSCFSFRYRILFLMLRTSFSIRFCFFSSLSS